MECNIDTRHNSVSIATKYDSLEVSLQSFKSKNLSVTKQERFKKSMSVVSEKIDKMENRAIIKYLYLKGFRGKEIYEDMVNTLHNDFPSYATVENWVACFKRGKLSIQDDERPGRFISVSTPENIDLLRIVWTSRRYKMSYSPTGAKKFRAAFKKYA